MRMTNVLIAEDDHSARSGLAQLLSHAGFNVTTAADGREALDIVDRQPQDVLLLDLWMPHLNGLQVLRQLAQRVDPPRVIVMTGDDTPETVLLTLRQDAHQFISKPIDAQSVIDMLHAMPASHARGPSIVVLSARAGWLELLLPCTHEIADRIESYLANLDTDLPDDVRASVAVVFRELLLDAMAADGHFDPQRRVRIACLRARRMIMFRIADGGYGFRASDGIGGAPHRPDRAPAAGAAAPLRPGLVMARDHVDELLVNEARDEVVFIKYLD
jgi:CheY-like chemotaxis protein